MTNHPISQKHSHVNLDKLSKNYEQSLPAIVLTTAGTKNCFGQTNPFGGWHLQAQLVGAFYKTNPNIRIFNAKTGIAKKTNPIDRHWRVVPASEPESRKYKSNPN